MNGLINIRVEDKEPEVQATAQASDILHEEEETDKGSKVSKFFHFFFSIFLGSKEEMEEFTSLRAFPKQIETRKSAPIQPLTGLKRMKRKHCPKSLYVEVMCISHYVHETCVYPKRYAHCQAGHRRFSKSFYGVCSV